MEIIYAKPNQVNTLGRVGENLRRDMLFDIGAYLDAYEAATFLLLHRPHGYVAAYPVHGTTVEGEFLDWPVTSADTSVEGSGECELIVYSGQVVAKTVIYKTLVLRALSDGGEIPDPLEEWQKRMLEAEETAVEAGTAAEAAAETAQGAAETAREQADRAEASAQEIDGAIDEAREAAHDAQEAARTAQHVADMGVAAETLEPGSDVSVEKMIDPDTGEITLHFGITEGEPGAPGYSPSVEVVDIEGGHRVVIYDAEGGNVFDVMDGEKGDPGDPGQPGDKGDPGDDGFSPTASVSKSGSTATITITDKTGTTTATVSDGAKGDPGDPGQPGADGISPTASVSKSGSTATITITDKNGTTTATVSDGAKGDQGDDYVLTAQDKADIAALVTPEPVTVSGSTPNITAAANTRYICGTVSTLTFTPSATGICDVQFTSGSTPTVLTVPSTVLWPDWFDPTALEANTVYEINIMDGEYGAVAAWS